MRSKKRIYANLLSVFIASDLTTSRQKLLSRFELNIGDIAPKTFKTININVISLIDGTLELQQVVRYHVANSQSTPKAGVIRKGTEDKSTHEKSNSIPDVTLNYIEDAIVKSIKDTITIPCVAEFVFTGQFFSLNKDPLKKAVKHEDFLFQVGIN